MFLGIRPIKTKGTIISQTFLNESLLEHSVPRPLLRKAESTALLLDSGVEDRADYASNRDQKTNTRKFSQVQGESHTKVINSFNDLPLQVLESSKQQSSQIKRQTSITKRITFKVNPTPSDFSPLRSQPSEYSIPFIITSPLQQVHIPTFDFVNRKDTHES